MNDAHQAEAQLRRELAEAQQRIAELESLETEHRRTQETLKRRADQLALINQIGHQIAATLDLESVLTQAALLIQKSFGYQHVGLFIVDETRQELVMRARAGSYAALMPSDHRLRWGTGMIGWVAQHGQRLLANNVSAEPRFHNPFPSEVIRAELSVPIKVGEVVGGVLDVSSRQLNAFDENDVLVIETLADQLAVAIQNAQLWETLVDYSAALEQAVKDRTENLLRSTERIEAILNSSSDAIILTDTEGAIAQTNPTFDRLFKYERDDLFRQPLTSVVHSDYIETLRRALRATVDEKQIQQLEVLANRQDHSTFYAEIGLSLIEGSGNRSRGIVCSLRDITERKQAEERLLKTLEQERELSELKTRFVSMTSHEFRTPLTIIVSSAELLERHLDRMSMAQKRKHFEKIQTSAQHMTRLLDDVLIIGKTDAGQLRIHPMPFDLKRLCREVLEDVQLSAAPNIELAFIIESQYTDVVMDKTLLRYILSNLLTNAVKYSPGGGTVQLEIHCGTDQTVIRVADEGIGIPEKDQKRLFEAFHRAQNVGAIKGSGLGLTITKRAVMLHGGSIHFESQVGVGTTFTVTLPTAMEQHNDEDSRN